MSNFVLDASVTLAWLIDGSIDPYAMRVRQLLMDGNTALVPSLWRFEIANGFVVAERRRILTADHSKDILHRFEAVLGQAIRVVSDSLPIGRVLATARNSGLTAYDAAYLLLAQEEQVPIATLDRRLADTAKQAGVPLVR